MRIASFLTGLAAYLVVHPKFPMHANAAQPRAAAVGEALVGAWALDTARSHYGPGVDRRRWERFTCAAIEAGLRCTIEAERADGRRVAGRFTATADGSTAPVAGVPGMDAVRVRTVSASIADATFYERGIAVFGYRAYRAPNGQTLTIVAVDPVSRAALTSVIVYARANKR